MDNFFRRWVWFLLPIVLFGALGVLLAAGSSTNYRSASSLNASRSPLVEEVQIRGTEISDYESPAAGTARLINEQLSTNTFLDDIAARASLTEALEAGLLYRHDLRAAIGASATGVNLLRISAQWDNPEIAYALVDSTIAAYQDYLYQVVSSDGIDATDFWMQKESEAVEEAQDAASELVQYLESVPANEDLRTADQLVVIDSLQRRAEAAQTDVADARDQIDNAELAVQQAASETGRLLQVVDPPEVPAAPEPQARQQAMTVFAFLVMGVLVSSAALLLTTVMDRSIRSASQLAAASGVDIAIAVPVLRKLRRPNFASVRAEEAT